MSEKQHIYTRKRRTLRLPITLSVVLMTLNVALMVCWIVLLAQLGSWSALTIGTVIFALILAGLIVYLVVTVKEVRVNQRQANFVDSVTHELKTPLRRCGCIWKRCRFGSSATNSGTSSIRRWSMSCSGSII